MANNKSSIKRIRINKRQKKENIYYKSVVKTYMKQFFKTVENFKKDQNLLLHAQLITIAPLTYSKIDKAKKKNILHKNNAARKKSRITKTLNKLKPFFAELKSEVP